MGPRPPGNNMLMQPNNAMGQPRPGTTMNPSKFIRFLSSMPEAMLFCMFLSLFKLF